MYSKVYSEIPKELKVPIEFLDKLRSWFYFTSRRSPIEKQWGQAVYSKDSQCCIFFGSYVSTVMLDNVSEYFKVDDLLYLYAESAFSISQGIVKVIVLKSKIISFDSIIFIGHIIINDTKTLYAEDNVIITPENLFANYIADGGKNPAILSTLFYMLSVKGISSETFVKRIYSQYLSSLFDFVKRVLAKNNGTAILQSVCTAHLGDTIANGVDIDSILRIIYFTLKDLSCDDILVKAATELGTASIVTEKVATDKFHQWFWKNAPEASKQEIRNCMRKLILSDYYSGTELEEQFWKIASDKDKQDILNKEDILEGDTYRRLFAV